MTTEMTNAANPAAPPMRTARGRFAPGNPGGPGRPPKVAQIERELLACMATVLSPEIWMRVTEAMAIKAMEGNVAAANWLSKTFMTGGLSKAAAAQAVGITAEAEMLVLGKEQHPEWARLLDERMAEEGDQEERDRDAAPAITAQPASATSPDVADVGASHCPAQASSPETEKTVRTDETVERARVAATAGSTCSMAPGSAPAPPSSLTVPHSERVRGLRVTKGPRPPENDRKRSQTATLPVVSPPTPCVAR
jgi:hypothetical protein